jgi:MoaA/NifB/PqqE/SkfB family radical SAM enzyme
MSEHNTLVQLEPELPEPSFPAFRVAPSLNKELLDQARRPALPPRQPAQRLPEPVYPQHPDARERQMSFKEYNRINRSRNVHCWLLPYFRARVRVKEFRPILSYLFTEWKCNLDCHYCWAFDNRIHGMTEDVALRSIDWLHSVGCRVAAIMGGEPLLRPQFIHKLVYYGAKRGFFMYLPTNGRLMRPEVIDRIGDAGVAVWNLAVDAVAEKPGLPKALAPIGPYFEYLVRMQRHYGFMAFFNINICRNNIEDVKLLTEIARDHGIATDYHINEPPMLSQEHFRHTEENPTFLRPDDYPRVDDLLDYLSDKNRAGYKMVNSVRHFQDMKKFMRGVVEPWECRAGRNTSLIRIDGTLAPCFSMYSATHDWGTIEDPRFDPGQLSGMKRSCNAHCLSTCQHTVGYAFSARRVLKWLARQALRGFRGVSGSF